MLERAIAYALGGLLLVTRDDLYRATPCGDWDVGTLLAHLDDSLAALYEAAVLGHVALPPAADRYRLGGRPDHLPAPGPRPTQATGGGAPGARGLSPLAESMGVSGLPPFAEPADACELSPPAGARGGQGLSPLTERMGGGAASVPGRTGSGRAGGRRASEDGGPAAVPGRAGSASTVVRGGLGEGGPVGRRAGRDPVLVLRDRAVTTLGAWAGRLREHWQAGGGLISVGGCPATAAMVTCAGAVEVAVHAWDLARACGRPRPMPPEMAADLLAVAGLLVTDDDRRHRFAVPVDLPARSSAADRLLAFLGRDPDWTRSRRGQTPGRRSGTS
jgi:uncharacterized protein (TIGR03086 family)